MEQEISPSPGNIYPESSSKLPLTLSSLSSTSSIEDEEKIISSLDLSNITVQMPPSSSYVLQETKQLLDILSSSSTTQNLYSSRFASEV